MKKLISNITKINDQMLSIADQEDWSNLLKKSQQRDLYLRDYFSNLANKTDSELTLGLFDLITESDEKVAKKIENNKNKTIANTLSLKHSQNAIKSYQKAQGRV